MKQPTQSKILAAIAALASVSLLISACAAPAAPVAPPATAAPAASTAPPEVTIELSDTGIKVPTVPGGIVAVTFKNTGAKPHGATVARLREGKTLNEVQEALKSDFMAAMALVSLVAIQEAEPSQSARAVYEFKQGDYLVVDDSDEKNPQMANFKVESLGNAAEPKADAVVEMTDFAFTMPDEVKAGPQTWQIVNKGKQWYEVLVVQLKEGQTIDDMIKMVEDPATQQGPPPLDFVAGNPPISEGERSWISVDLKPGTYEVVCVVPDLVGDGKSHLTHGMRKTITVK